MKKVYILVFCISATFVSCTKKCYKCDNEQSGQWRSVIGVCTGDPQYEYVKDNQPITDSLGNVYQCVKQ